MPKLNTRRNRRNIATSLRRPDWIQIWSGAWCLLSCSHFAEEYTRLIKFHGQPFLPEGIIVVRRGKSQGWARASDRAALCLYLAKEVATNTRRAGEICNDLKHQADTFLAFMAKYQGQAIDGRLYDEFWSRFVRYYQPHINVKYVVDGLTPKRLEQLLPYFEDARLHAESVLNRTEEFLIVMAKRIAKTTKVPPALVLCVDRHEMRRYFRTGKLPSLSVLKQRNELCIFFSDRRREAMYLGKDAKIVESLLAETAPNETLQGMTAFPGKATGTVRVVHDPKKAGGFQKGDILVAGMTRPEYLPLMKKASAFVTDAGGILSHAAIVARELKKPCVIGTKVATKVFKDGDRVEVDATNGIVKKL